MKTTTTLWQWLLAVLCIGTGITVAHYVEGGWPLGVTATATALGVFAILRLEYESAAHREGRLQVKAQQKRRRVFMADRLAEGMTERQAANAWFATLVAEDMEASVRRRYGMPEGPRS